MNIGNTFAAVACFFHTKKSSSSLLSFICLSLLSRCKIPPASSQRALSLPSPDHRHNDHDCDDDHHHHTDHDCDDDDDHHHNSLGGGPALAQAGELSRLN